MIEGFFDIENVLAKLDKKGDFLVSLNETIEWERFRPILSRIRKVHRKSKAGRKPYDELLMFKILILQSLYNMSDEKTEVMILDRLSFRRFLGVGFSDNVPDATTIWLFRDVATRMGLIKRLFREFDLQLTGKGLCAKQGSMIDASMVQAPRQKIDKEEKKELEETGKVEEWNEPKSRQKDVDADWTKKNDKSYFGYKNHICVDVENKFIRKYEVSKASLHDSQMTRKLLDYTNSSGKVYADSAYMSKKTLSFLDSMGFISKICRKGTCVKPLTKLEHRGNKTKSKIRARVEHVFGMQKMMAGDLILRSIGIVRATAKIGLRNLAYNMRRLVTILKSQPSTA
jgi:IS5 family transposase